LALMLLIGSGLLINSFIRLVIAERNYDPDGMILFDIRVPLEAYLKGLGSDRGLPILEVSPPTAFFQRVYEQLRSLPGASSVAGSSFPPVDSLVLPTMQIVLDGSSAENVEATYFLVTPGFFDTMKTPFTHGRDFDAKDTASSPWVAVVNETAARRFWPGQDPVGKRFTLDVAAGEKPREVVGVVRDVPLRYLRTEADPVIYVSYLQQSERYRGPLGNMFGQMRFLLRANGDPMSLIRAARQAVAQVDPDRPIAGIQITGRYGGVAVRNRGYYALVVGVFAVTATLLAAIGVYGALSYSVSRRTREIGIRLALGARAVQILSLLGRQGLLLFATGLALGFAGSVALTRLISSQLWGVTPTDPLTFAAVTALLALVAGCACLVPIRRAIRIDPTEALRSD
jgi:putative ABC transport system permease protein